MSQRFLRFLKATEVADLLRISPAKAYSLIARRALPSIRIGGAVRVPAEALERWIAERETRAAGRDQGEVA